jgi:hypothetical protein
MKDKLWKMFKAVVFTCCFSIAGSVAVYAQLPDIPGSSGSPVRDRSAADDAASRRDAEQRVRDLNVLGIRKMTVTDTDVKDQFAEYSAIDKVLGISIGALRDEYEEDKQDIPVLQPKQLFAVKLLVRGANRIHPGKVTKRGFLDKLKDGVSPRSYLQSRGFTKSEIDGVFADTGKTLAEIRKDSQK